MSEAMKRTMIIDMMIGVAAAASVGCVFAFAVGEEKVGAVLAGVACVLTFGVIPAVERRGGAR